MAVRERTIRWQFIDTEDLPKVGLTVTVKLTKQEQTDLNQIVVVDPEVATTDEHGRCEMSLIVTDDYIGRSLYAASWPGQPEVLFYLPLGDGNPIEWTVLVHEESPVIPPGDLPRLVPPGGKTGEVLTKASDANYDDYWSAESGKGPPGPAGGYAYYADSQMTFDPITAPLPAANEHEFFLLHKTFDGPLFADVPFTSFYEGFFYIDVGSGDGGAYDFTLTVEHLIGDVSFTSTRTFRARITANAEYAVPLAVFNSVAVVSVGTYTDANGQVVTITEQMLTQPTTLAISLVVSRVNAASFVIETASIGRAGAAFWQQALGTVSLAKGQKGDKGDTGQRGSEWFNGNGVPGTIAGALAGDYYFDDSGTGDIYTYNGTVWEKIATIEGQKGDKGDPGRKGDTGDQGPPGPAGSLGLDLVGETAALTNALPAKFTSGGDDIAQTDLADIILLGLTYTRSNSDLNMSGILKKDDIPELANSNNDEPVGAYRFQIQGAGGDYVSLWYNSDGVWIRQNSNSLSLTVAKFFDVSDGGVPDGGTTGQVLAKRSDDDRDTEWVDQSGGGGSFTPTQENIYPATKAILDHGGQEVISVQSDDTDSEITFGVVAGSIIQAMLGAASVGSNQIGDGVVQGKHIAARTVTMGKLAASGTASDSTFLRGDGQWATPSGGSDLEIDDEGTAVTAAAKKLNFTGTGVTVTSDENGNVTITIGGSGPDPGTHKRYVGWSNSITPSEAEISRGTSHEQDSFPVPQRAANGWVWFATPVSIGGVSAVYWGNNQQVNQLGGFTRTQRQIDSTNYYLYTTDAEQNATIVGTGTFQIRLEY